MALLVWSEDAGPWALPLLLIAVANCSASYAWACGRGAS